MQQHTVSKAQRLDAFLAGLGILKSRIVVQRIIKAGGVSVNGKKTMKSSHRLEEGDTVSFKEEVMEMTKKKSSLKAIDLSIAVLYEDDACIVIDKPRDVTVHPALSTGNDPTVLHGALWLMKERGLPLSPSETLVHRLDKETTGCLLLAKTPAAHQMLQKQFEARTVMKQYLAVCAGVPAERKALIDAPIGRHVNDRTKMSVIHAGRGSRSAQTTYEILDESKDAALLLCTLHTGRTHQIRVHLASIGHPILGDETYGSKASLALGHTLKIETLCLHAWKLRFVSPATKKAVTVEAPIPAVLEKALKGLRLEA